MTKSQSVPEVPRKDAPLQPKTIQKKPIPQMKLVSHYVHPEKITSNFVMVYPKQLIFGDSRGGINSRGWSDSKVTTVQSFDCPVRCLRHFPNNNYPLLCASNGRGHLLTFSLSEENIPLAGGFRFPNMPVSSVDSIVEFDIDPIDRRIIAYEPTESDSVMLFDMNSERFMDRISFTGKTVNRAGYIAGTSTFGVCTNTGFEVYDLRAKECALSVNLSTPPLDFRSVDPTINSFMLCSLDGLVASFDFRESTPNLNASLRISSGRNIEALSFDMHASSTLASVGYSHGIVMVDLDGRKEISLSGSRQVLGGRTMSRVSRVLFHRSNHASIAVVHDNNAISVMTEIIERD